ncbi:MAG: ABC transporter ATP-binding protein [Nannocystaceae bacterium]
MNAPTTSPRLVVRGLAHRYGDREVLRDVGFDVAPGELVGLLGPNGSGKSTVLSALQGLLRPDAATLTLDGSAVAPGGPELRARLGVVFQQPSVDKALTARENLRLTLRMHGVFGERQRARVDELLAWAGLSERADEPMKQFSGGMLRRIDLVRAVATSPDLLLMDEPTSGLDEASFRRVWTLVDELRAATGTSVIVATHRPEEAARCDRLVVLHEGHVVTVQTPSTLIEEMDADVLVLETEHRAQVGEVLAQTLGLTMREEPFGLSVGCSRGPELLVDVVRALPRDMIGAISIRRPTLADAFMRLAGASLDASEPTAENRSQRAQRGAAAS